MSVVRFIGLSMLLLGGLLTAMPASAASESQTAQLRAQLEAHPELILDVLEKHSDKLLDMLQAASDKRRRGTLVRQWEQDRKVPKKVVTEGCPVGGSPDAPVTVIAFSDFLCSYCHQAAFTLGNLMKRYPGKIKMVFKLVPKDEEGRLAGRWFLAAYGLDKAKAWKFYALLYDRQKELETDAAASLRALAAEAGFDVKALEAEVVRTSKDSDAQMQVNAADARNLGFVGTPYFLINDMIIRGALPLDNFVDAVELALQKPKKK